MSKCTYHLIPIRLDIPIYGEMGRLPGTKRVTDTKGHPRIRKKHARFTKYGKKRG